jgi:hypothetical protein
LRYASGGDVPTYRVLRGISYPPNKRAEIGDVVNDIPSRSIKWLVDSGVIEKADDSGKPAKNAFTEEDTVEAVEVEIAEISAAAELDEEEI